MTASTLSTAELSAIAAKCQADAMSASVAELLPRLAERLRSTDARADAAEQRIAGLEAWARGVDAVLANLCWGRRDAQRVRKPLATFPLTAERDRLDAERERVARELAAITTTGNASQ